MGKIGMEGLCRVFAVRDLTRNLRVRGGKSATRSVLVELLVILKFRLP
jgi:hypothetical protein